MQKFISVLLLSLLYVTITFGQAAVEIPFTVANNAGDSQVLIFGLDPTATGGIDPGLETELPPHAPTNIFLTHFVSSVAGGSNLGNGTFKDIRNAPAFPFTGQHIHQIWYGVGPVGTEITISWSLPPEIAATSVIQDLFGGVFYQASFSGTGSLTITNPNIVAWLEIIVDYEAMLPVELTSFTASVNESEVVLSWITATEVNNSGFNVERNSGEAFETIGFVPGYGTTTESRSYSFTDEDLQEGRYIYRLKQIDLNGSFEYSDEIEVDVVIPIEHSLSQNFPNPFNPSTIIKYSIPEEGLVTLKVFTAIGEEVIFLVNEVKQSGVYEIEFNASNLPSGMYFYRLQSGSFVETKKMILLK